MSQVSLPSNCLLDPTVSSDRLLGNTTGESILQKSQGRLTSCVAWQTVTGQTHLWCCPVDSHRTDSPLVLPSRQSQDRLTSGVAQHTVAGQTHLWCCPVDSRRADSPLVLPGRQSQGRLTSGVARQTVAGQIRYWCHPADISRADLLLVSLKDSHKADLPLVSPGSRRVDLPLVSPGRQSQGRLTFGVAQ